MKDSIFVIQSLMDSDDSDDDEESSGGGEEPDEELFQIAKDNRITTASCASMLAGGIANIGQNRLLDSDLQDSFVFEKFFHDWEIFLRL